METKVLNEIGFTEAEKKVYLTLLELGSVTAAPILEKTDLQNSVFYRTIHRLMKKGFVSFIKKGKIKHYKAADPEILLTYLKERENKLQKLIPKLREKQKLALEKQEAEVYISLKGLKTVLYSIIEDAKPREKFYFFQTGPEIYEELQEKLMLGYDQLRKEKKLDVYGIFNIESKKVIKKGRYPKTRYVDFPIPPSMVIFRDMVVVISWKDIKNARSVLITSKEIADQYKEFFNSIWKMANP